MLCEQIACVSRHISVVHRYLVDCPQAVQVCVHLRVHIREIGSELRFRFSDLLIHNIHSCHKSYQRNEDGRYTFNLFVGIIFVNIGVLPIILYSWLPLFASPKA